ncbi:YddF family protein [Ectothiorhodospira haloalkaliphila]|uniref:YddF family protein n=1 Tax=Ectothiorhodospira haloalkaliphila TaxID=421628 RepID=UPI001EE8F420|nr:YddF family protein [Ectothiorhodospira haloalkaliphila]MCG5525866.1 YddF family protein [Ectothiorhodospira haloalkaliphila]
MSTFYLLNAPVLTDYGQWLFEGPITPEHARELIPDGFVSAIGHDTAAEFLAALLRCPVPVNRTRIIMHPGDQALVLRLQARLPEGQVLDATAMRELPFELGLLSRTA